MKAGHAPVIVVRRKKHHATYHGGAWKVAYADFVTAMMAFFMVMWLSAQDSVVRQAIAGYFSKPGVLPQTSSDGIMSGKTGIDPNSLPTLDKENERRNEKLQSEVRERFGGLPTFFCGRLSTYTDIDQDQAIERAFACADAVERELASERG
jgi:chemotaxis protein MotB